MNEIQKYQLSGKLPLPVRNFFGKYIFIPNEGSFTRGIGKQAGLQDLLTSGIVRGNPKGTGMTPKQYNRVRFNGRDKDFWRPLMAEHKNILNNFYNQTLSEPEWNSLRKAYLAYNNPIFPMATPVSMENETYADYLKNGEGHFQLTWDEFHPENEGNPPAYFYNDGRNPFGEKSYDYAKSNYAVRLNNADTYGRYVPQGHIHESIQQPLSLMDPNLELFARGPFGLGIKINKETGVPMWKPWGSPIKDWNLSKLSFRSPFIKEADYNKVVPDNIRNFILDSSGNFINANSGGAENPFVFIDKAAGKIFKVSDIVPNQAVGIKQVNHLLDKQNIGSLGIPSFYEGLLNIGNDYRIVTSQPLVKSWETWGDFSLPFIMNNLKKAGYKGTDPIKIQDMYMDGYPYDDTFGYGVTGPDYFMKYLHGSQGKELYDLGQQFAKLKNQYNARMRTLSRQLVGNPSIEDFKTIEKETGLWTGAKPRSDYYDRKSYPWENDDVTYYHAPATHSNSWQADLENRITVPEDPKWRELIGYKPWTPQEITPGMESYINFLNQGYTPLQAAKSEMPFIKRIMATYPYKGQFPKIHQDGPEWIPIKKLFKQKLGGILKRI